MTSKRHSSSNSGYSAAKLLFITTMSLLCWLSCTVPAPDDAGTASSQGIPTVDIVSSIRDRKSPPILGINYVKTLGRAGQGAGEFHKPAGLVVDDHGQLYVADAGNNRVQVIDSNGHFVTEFGSRGWREGQFDFPTDVALSFERNYLLYVADTGNNRVQFCNLVNRIFYLLTTTEPVSFQLDAPEGVGIGRNGEVSVVDTRNHRWIQFSSDRVPVGTLGSFGSGREQFWHPTDLTVDSHGTVYVADTGNHRIQCYDFSGNSVRTWGTEGEALGQFREPKRIALDTWNNVYVTDSGNRRIQIFTPEGHAITEFSTNTLLHPDGIAVSAEGRVFVSDAEANDIKVFRVIFKANSTLDPPK